MRAATYSLLALMAIAACSADLVVVTKPLSAADGAPAVLSAQLAMIGATLPLCQGTNDALPIVFSHPLAEEPMTESFTVRVGDETITPNCATLAPADEENERQTVLLLGQFQLADTFQPMEVSIRDITLQVNGSTVPLVSEDRYATPLLDTSRSLLILMHRLSGAVQPATARNGNDIVRNACPFRLPTPGCMWHKSSATLHPRLASTTCQRIASFCPVHAWQAPPVARRPSLVCM